MRSRSRSLLVAVLSLVGLSTTAIAQSGSIAGKVTAKRPPEPLADVNIEALRGGVTVGRTLSKADGSYTLTGLSDGVYTVIARRIGFALTVFDSVRVQGGAATALDISPSQTAPLALDAMVTTGDKGARAEKVLDSPNSIYVVPQMHIASRPVATPIDHLKAVPGLAVSTGSIVQSNVVSRGFNNAFSGSMLMLQDYRFAGVPSLRVNVPFLFTGSNEDIERIEVLQGPAAALYGPNSGNGVLHIITKSPFESKGTTLSVGGGVRAGTETSGGRTLGRLSGRHAGMNAARTIGYKFSGEYFTGHDFEYIDPNEPTTFPSNDPRVPAARAGQPVKRDFGIRKATGEARVDYRLNEDTEFITTVGYSQMGSAIEITTVFGAAQAKNWTYSNFQERFRHKQFFAQVFYNQNDAGNTDSTDESGTFYLRQGIPIVDRSSVLVGQVQQGLQYGRTRFLVGAEAIATRPKTEGTINGRNDTDDNINELGAYLHSTTELTKKLDLVAAVRGDNNSRIEGSQLSPRAALVFRPMAGQTLRATFNRALSTPASFAFFLDQYAGLEPAPGLKVWAMGNPPKAGWTVARTCGTDGTSLCMRSPYIPGMLTSASAAAAYPGFIASLPAIIQGLPSATIGGEPNRQALLGALAQFGPTLNALRPTDAEVGTRVFDLNAKVDTVAGDIGPLRAAFTNTWEVGYKGILKKRLTLSTDFWYQRRPAEPTTQVINPGILFNGPQLGTYLVTKLTQDLVGKGMPLAQAQATATQVGTALTPLMAAIPVGATAYDSPLYDKPYLVFSYKPASGYVDVSGIDLAAEYQLTNLLSVAATGSVVDRNIFTKAEGCPSETDPALSCPAPFDEKNPLASNVPKHRGSLALRYTDQEKDRFGELRFRYADPFRVNSGAFNSFNITPGTFVGTYTPYPDVPANRLFDLTLSSALPLARSPRFSITGTNLLNSYAPTFVGVPSIGRVIMTQLQYTF